MFSPVPKINSLFNFSQLNPMRRDTIVIALFGSATLRFVAYNPGVWCVHCYIAWHLSQGMAKMFESSAILQEKQQLPDEMVDHCKKQGIPHTGNAGGVANSTHNFGLYPLPPIPLSDITFKGAPGAQAKRVLHPGQLV